MDSRCSRIRSSNQSRRKQNKIQAYSQQGLQVRLKIAHSLLKQTHTIVVFDFCNQNYNTCTVKPITPRSAAFFAEKTPPAPLTTFPRCWAAASNASRANACHAPCGAPPPWSKSPVFSGERRAEALSVRGESLLVFRLGKGFWMVLFILSTQRDLEERTCDVAECCKSCDFSCFCS